MNSGAASGSWRRGIGGRARRLADEDALRRIRQAEEQIEHLQRCVGCHQAGATPHPTPPQFECWHSLNLLGLAHGPGPPWGSLYSRVFPAVSHDIDLEPSPTFHLAPAHLLQEEEALLSEMA